MKTPQQIKNEVEKGKNIRIEGKTFVSNLNIELQGTHGIRLTIERPNQEDVSIVIDKVEFREALEDLGVIE